MYRALSSSVGLTGLTLVVSACLAFTSPAAGAPDDAHARAAVYRFTFEIDNDRNAASGVFSDGENRYMLGAHLSSGHSGSFTDTSASVETDEQWGAHIAYERWWTANLYSTAIWSWSEVRLPATLSPGIIALGVAPDATQTVQVYLQWIPVPGMILGLEWNSADVEVNNALVGFDDHFEHRVQIRATFRF